MAEIDLSDCPVTEQVYCPYCDSVAPSDPQAYNPFREYHICPRCNLYGQMRRYLSLYFFYFVFAWNEGYCCTLCMRRDAWNILLLNLPAVLPLPYSLIQMLRAYCLGRSVPGFYAANRLHRRRRYERAAAAFQQVAQRVGPGAPIHYNRGLSLLSLGDKAAARDAFQRAMIDCGNFEPARQGLILCGT